MSPSRISAPALSMISGVITAQSPILSGYVDHDAAVDEIIERQRGHVALAVVGRVHGAVEMGADMQRGVDALGDDHLRLQVLRVVHLVAGIADPARRMHVHHVTHVDDLHQLILFGCATVNLFVMPGLVPASRLSSVEAAKAWCRDKPGHDVEIAVSKRSD